MSILSLIITLTILHRC